MQFREERTDLVLLLCELKDAQKDSHKGDMYTSAIRQTRRKILGLYRKVLNTRKPVDNVTTALAVVV